MAQTSATTAQGQGGTLQAVRSRVRSDMRDTAIQSHYKAVRSATRALAANISAEDQMVQSCPEASPMKWHQTELAPPTCERIRLEKTQMANGRIKQRGKPLPTP